MSRFDRDKAVEVAKNAVADYMTGRLPEETNMDEVVEIIVSAIYLDYVKPATEWWKRRLGSEIQNLQLRESLLSCHLRMYIAHFGTPDLKTLVLGARESGGKQ